MSDCSNVTMRERLPDHLHGTLSPAVEAELVAHLATCATCAEELAVLRAVRGVLALPAARRPDTAAIVAALPRPVRRATPGWQQARWRLAAAVTLMTLGGVSVATAVRSFGGGSPVADTTVAVDVPVSGPAVVATVDSPGRPVQATPARLTAGGGIDDLADEDLEALIGALETIETMPHAEPEALRLTRLVPSGGG